METFDTPGELVRRYQKGVKKRFGQHFLVDPTILGSIADAAGRPVPSDTQLDEIGAYQANLLKVSTAWLEHGDTDVVEHDLACVQADGPNALPVGVRNRYQERCDGLLDSDGDGVYDQKDGCLTPQSLLDRGYTAQANGCVFEHDAAYLPPTNSYQPGTIRRQTP